MSFSQQVLINPGAQRVRHEELNDSTNHIVVNKARKGNQSFAIHEPENSAMVEIVTPSAAARKLVVAGTHIDNHIGDVTELAASFQHPRP